MMTIKYVEKVKRIIENTLSIENLSQRTNKRDVVDARKIFCYIVRQNTTLSFNAIGVFANIDHSTVIFSIKKATTLIKNDAEFRNKYNKVLKLLPEETIGTTDIIENEKKEKKLNNKIKRLEDKIETLKTNYNYYTPNELAYRKLSDTDKHNYDIRTSAILKMMNVKERQESSKFEFAECQL